ncbi:hypothetical protein BDY24DRAFT_257323 [Mrakia frigida]|uniref:J domain-containing protein n=1 Tax=Mrakia frigida TaxID=29902 RepID=UPI003FCBFB4E
MLLLTTTIETDRTLSHLPLFLLLLTYSFSTSRTLSPSMDDDAGPSSRVRASISRTPNADDEEEDLTSSSASPGQIPKPEGKGGQDSLYSILNLPKDASTEAISQRYKSLAVLLHPDKQRTPEARAAAETHFLTVQRAYEVLSDVNTRAIYDALGEEGLGMKMDVGPKLMTAEELREMYTRQAAEKKQVVMQRLVNPKGDISINIDATTLSAPKAAFFGPRGPQDDSLLTRLNFVQATSLGVGHSFQAALSPATTLTVAGRMKTMRGRGGAKLGGSFLGTITHTWSPNLYLEVSIGLLSTSLLQPQVTGTRVVYQIDDDTSVQLSTQSPSIFVPPTLDLTIFRLLYPSTTSYVTYKSGFFTLGSWGASFIGRRQDQSALVIGLTSQTQIPASKGVAAGGWNWTSEVEVGPSDMGLSADWGRKVLGGEVDLKVGSRFGTSELKGWVSGARKVGENVRITVTVEAQSTTGITLKIRFFRLGQSVTLPILLTRALDAQHLILSALLPCAAYTALHHLYLAPRKRSRATRRIAELMEENQELLDQMKKEAEDAVQLLAPLVERRREEELKTDGLIIVDAQYGALSNFSGRGLGLTNSKKSTTSSKANPDHIDVKIALQALVNDSQLIIPAGRSKAGLLGFYDCALGSKKRLRVRYLYRGRLHEVTVDDSSPLLAPLREHALE